MCLVLESLTPQICMYIYIYICVWEVLGLCNATRSEHLHRIQAIFGLNFDLLGAAWKTVGGCWRFVIFSVVISPSLLGAAPPQELSSLVATALGLPQCPLTDPFSIPLNLHTACLVHSREVLSSLNSKHLAEWGQRLWGRKRCEESFISMAHI